MPEELYDTIVTRFDAESDEINDEMSSIMEQIRATNYLSTAMIYLRDNAYLSVPLSHSHIKERLLGHWGTCPGINMIYSHVNRLIRINTDRDFFIVNGPGHGNPAILANYYIEGTLGHFYPSYDLTRTGFDNLICKFSVPGGFPSHTNAELPSINEGGELGYALATSFGAIMDLPRAIAVTIVGDGENETGPSCTAWHSHKYIDYAESGFVLPILHCNGFKIAERTIYGCMSDNELDALFSGFGWQVRIVSCKTSFNEHDALLDINRNLAMSLDWALTVIKYIQDCAKSGKPIVKPRPPMIVLRTPKGMSGIRSFNGNLIEGSWRSHQVPLTNPKIDARQLEAVATWLASYRPHDLFDSNGIPNANILKNIPHLNRCCGMQKLQYNSFVPLSVPSWIRYGCNPSERSLVSATQALGEYTADVIKANKDSFRIFSPDELESNKLGAVLQVTSRNFQWDPETAHTGGRVIEVLSEHQCQGFLQGYLLTGRHGLFPSYEAFLSIVSSMMVQYAKFAKMAQTMKWRGDVGSLNYLASSGWEIQSHNGYSHQGENFMNDVINMKHSIVRVYLPADVNCLLSTFAHCYRSRNHVNLVIASKMASAVYLSPEEAERHCIAGISVWHKFSSLRNCGNLPDVVLACCGAEVTFETLVASKILRGLGVTVSVVNINDLMVLCGPELHPHALDDVSFRRMFPNNVPVILNFHGYPSAIKGLLFDRTIDTSQFCVLGYIEEGTTTTPFHMMTMNKTSRYDICIESVKRLSSSHLLSHDAHLLVSSWQHDIRQHYKYVMEHSKDPDGIYDLAMIYS